MIIQGTYWLDIDDKDEVLFLDVRNFSLASVFVATPNGLGSAVLEVRKSYDRTTTVAYSPVKALTTSAPVESIDVSSVPYLAVVVTTAGTPAEKCLITLYVHGDQSGGSGSGLTWPPSLMHMGG